MSVRADSLSDLAQGRHGEVDNLAGIVLDLAGGGKVLGELAVALRDRLEVVPKGHGAHPGRAGVEGEDEFHRVRLVRCDPRDWCCDWRSENCEKEFKEVVDFV